MKEVFIERSTPDGRGGDWAAELPLGADTEKIVVGIGPGSFAGIRSALAYAQGFALGSRCGVWGLPSPCAAVGELMLSGRAAERVAVVGDARQGMIWVQLFTAGKAEGTVFQVPRAGLAAAVKPPLAVYTTEPERLGELLAATFAARYRGEVKPTARGLAAYAAAHPDELVAEPLPVYLNPAVRPELRANH